MVDASALLAGTPHTAGTAGGVPRGARHSQLTASPDWVVRRAFPGGLPSEPQIYMFCKFYSDVKTKVTVRMGFHPIPPHFCKTALTVK